MSGFRALVCTMMFGSALPAADLGSELACWGPVATDAKRSIDDGLWFIHGAALYTCGDRAAGGRGSGPDGEVVVGWARDDTIPGFIIPESSQVLRAFARLGTDPLAEHGGEPLMSIGGVASAPFLLSAQGQLGWSGDRGTVVDGEVSFFLLRVRYEADDHQETLRIGSGPRLMGSTAPWAWGVLADWAITTVDGEARDEGAIIEGYLIARPWNHVLMGVQISNYIHVRSEGELVRVTFLLGTTF